MSIGGITPLSPGEIELAGGISTKTTGLTRSWEYWSMRVAKAGGMPVLRKVGPAAKRAKARKVVKRKRR
jgi:hypothetical protein